MSSIIAGIGAIKATLDLAKITTDLVNRPTIDAEKVRGNLHEMLIHAVSAQSALVDAQLEMSDLYRQLDDRKHLDELRADMEFVQDGGYFVKKSEVAAGNVVEYCPVCWGESTKAIPLKRSQPGAFMCAIHKVSFNTRAFHDRQDEGVRRMNQSQTLRRGSW
jgi:hypothetical protein